MADGHLIEFKEVLSSGKSLERNINKAIGDAAKKSKVAVLKIKAKLNKNTIQQIGKGRLEQYIKLDRIIIINNNKSYSFTR
jgi:pyruvate/2-oxoglutarate dehydrogenase complex dihydrolipoamide dehydrogenase (E3) component